MNLNRYKFAKQLLINEAKTLSLGEPLLEIYNSSPASRIHTLKESLSEGIYFIGFDQNHVGYILKNNDELFVIHLNYIDTRDVEIERIGESIVLANYSKIYIAEI